MRRPLLILSALMTAALLAAAEPSLQVDTDHGTVEGRRSGSVRAFLGIPYAAPPTGELRWKPPVPAAKWTGVRQATAFGPRPMQPAIYPDMVFRDSGPSEDCLTLNVWTSAADAHAKQPVMVWIFGGGFAAGGTSEERQDGTKLAAKGVVVVSMNYRLGIFGFMVHPELVAESPAHAAGNYGLMDQLAGLQWVRDNIRAFGGDPANVTIFGESAGSMSVCAQMASPLARGLFHRAIGESGALHFAVGATVQPERESRARKDAAYLREKTGATTLAELRALPADTLAQATAKPSSGSGIHFGPTVDGYFLSERAAAIFAAGKQNDVPLLAGWNRDEGGVALPDSRPTVEYMRKLAADDFGADAAEFLRLYPIDSPARAARAGAEYRNDRFTAFGTWAWANSQLKRGHAPVYRFRFDRAPPADFSGRPNHAAYHSADILYVFGNLQAHARVPWEPVDREISDQLQAYWINFARTGNPNGAGLPEWPRYDDVHQWPVMYLGAPSVARPEEFRERYLFLNRVWKQ